MFQLVICNDLSSTFVFLLKTISSTNSNIESLFTPPTARKRPTADRTGDDDLAAGMIFSIPFFLFYCQSNLEHGTPPKTPRTGRRNRIDDQSSLQVNFLFIFISIFNLELFIRQHQWMSMIFKLVSIHQDFFVVLLKNFNNKHQVFSIFIVVFKVFFNFFFVAKKQLEYEEDEELNRVYVQLERSSIALHYSMGKSIFISLKSNLHRFNSFSDDSD